MKLKSVLLIGGLLLIGTVNAQEREVSIPPPPPPPPSGDILVVPSREIIVFPDVEADFPGGVEAMKKYIQENVQYPEVSRQLGNEGRVYLSFVVEPDGSITGVKVEKGLSPELNFEAKRLVKSMPAWKPAEVNGKKVRARCRLPITFILTKPEKKEEKG